jgi:ribonuclease HI
MINKKQKRFVVREGQKTWIFDSRDKCKNYVIWYPNAKYKSFLSLETAQKAYKEWYQNYIWKDSRLIESQKQWDSFDCKNKYCIFVDAACSWNPWTLERRWVDKNWKEIFRQWPYQDWTVNIWEFLAIVQWIAYLQKKWLNNAVIYSDSKTAINWVSNQKANTKLNKTDSNQKLFELIKRAENFLKNNQFQVEIKKRETNKYWEIPADFWRK